MLKERTWSHSSLNSIMNNPAEFYLNYVCGIKPKAEKTALSLGSAVHWGLEHEEEDLTEYYNKKGSFRQWNNYTEEQLLAECIVKAYLNRKKDIYDEILKDNENGKQLEIIDEYHELELSAKISSLVRNKLYNFLGIIDLLFLTEKGWILIDYKTGSIKIDYDEYKSQLFKYIYLLNYNFPDVPVYKICVVHLQKTNIRMKKNESEENFRGRIKMEYDLNEDNLIEAHIYNRNEFDDDQLLRSIQSLSKQIEIAEAIETYNLYFTNYNNIKTMYGPSQYSNIFYKKPDNYLLYIIKDPIYDEFEEKIVDYRDCDPIDMKVLDMGADKLLNKYTKFKLIVEDLFSKGINQKEEIKLHLNKNYICSNDLLEKYFITFNKNF